MKIVPISAFHDNYIWALTANSYCVVVDPGDAAPVQNYLAQHSLQLSAILITHHHNDHIGGIEALRAQTSVPVFGPDNKNIPHLTHPLQEGGQVDLPEIGAHFGILSIPGHTADHIAYYQPGMLFCGDTLFAGGCGRVLGGTAEQLFASLTRLSQLPAETLIYCAHEYTVSNLCFAQHVEPSNAALLARQQQCIQARECMSPTVPSSIGEERATNPFLRVQQIEIRAHAQKFAGHILSNDQAVFTALRNWKNEF